MIIYLQNLNTKIALHILSYPFRKETCQDEFLSLSHKSYKVISYIVYSVCYVGICVHLVAHRGWKSTSIVLHSDF